MADQNDSGDKTEQPTPKKLKDARKKGQVAKSKDVTATVGLLVWFVLASLAVGWAGTRLLSLMNAVFLVADRPFASAAAEIASQALQALLAISAATLAPVAAVGVLTEFLQVGPVFAVEKITPKFDGMNPAQGLKRMFSMDNLIEVAKALLKTVLLAAIGWLSIRALLPSLMQLPWAGRPESVGNGLWSAARPVLAATLAAFALLSVLDVVHQRWSFMKKMRMSRHDIKQEHKEQEGDPYIKARRRQTHQEWSQRNAAGAARNANVLVVNPTHVAIAIDYDRATCPVPTIAAKGEEDVARAMRAAAEEAGVPIVRNVPLARDLLARAEVGELIPADLFDVIAEVILWAREVRDELELRRQADTSPARKKPPRGPRRHAPGEDLTRYPDPARADDPRHDRWPPLHGA